LERGIAGIVTLLTFSSSSPGSINREQGVSVPFAGTTAGREVMPWVPHDYLLLSKDEKAFQWMEHQRTE